MRVALLYPPPWKIPSPGEPSPGRDGPPAGYRQGDLDADFYQTPYGLFTIGAQAIRAGHQVKVVNLSAFAWGKVEELIGALDADVYGLSCWTANRRGVALTADLIKRVHPKAHVVVGGPHATPLAQAMLAHHASIDTICVGESEATFLELLARIEAGEGTTGIAGTAYRAGGKPVLAPERNNLAELDTLACPHDHYDTHIVMTSRGCPWACTFCGAETAWGRGFRAHSVPYVLDAVERALARLPVKMIQIKDDTFTTNQKRVLSLCKGIRERGLKFLWSCDTRVDVLNEELLREMRLAGCQRLSLGVETGSVEILRKIDKKITVEEIMSSTALAKKYGIQVRYYMMLGNRGETADTFRETLRFLERAKPHQYVFSCLSVYPGTPDFHEAVRAGWLDEGEYFRGDFQELKVPFDASEEDTKLFVDWFSKNAGLRMGYRETAEERRAILERLGDHAPAALDLAVALFDEGKLDEAEAVATRALAWGHPTPGLALNALGCIAFARGDVEGMMARFSEAAKRDPQHYVLIQNVNAAKAWFNERGPERKLPLKLVARSDFQLLERTAQPALPGPLPADAAVWGEAPLKPAAASTYVRTPDTEGSRSALRERGRLKVVP